MGGPEVLVAVYLRGYEPVEHHAYLADSLRHPGRIVLVALAYIGGVFASGDPRLAAAIGVLGTPAAALRALRPGGGPPASLGAVGVMLFVVAAAAVTAAGRLKFGFPYALSSRYVIGSAAFWAAQLTHWSIAPPPLGPGPRRCGR